MASIWEKRRQKADEARLTRRSRETAAALKRAEREFVTAFRAERYGAAVEAAELIGRRASAQYAVIDEFNRRTEKIDGPVELDPETRAMMLFAPLGPNAFLAGALACAGREKEAREFGRNYIQAVDELLGVPGLPEDFFDEVGPAIRRHREFLGQAVSGGKSVAQWREWMLLLFEEVGM